MIKIGIKWTTVDAIEYYTRQVEQLKEDFDTETQSEPNPTGIAFVTVADGDKVVVTNVENDLLASGKTVNSMIVDNFRATPFKQPIKTNKDFNPRWWSVTHAPYPRYIIWSNLSRKGAYWYLYWFIINSILLLITIFLTTPTFIVQTIENLNITNPLEELVEAKSPLIASYIPTLMLWTFSALVPVLVWYAGYMEKHWTFRNTVVKLYSNFTNSSLKRTSYSETVRIQQHPLQHHAKVLRLLTAHGVDYAITGHGRFIDLFGAALLKRSSKRGYKSI